MQRGNYGLCAFVLLLTSFATTATTAFGDEAGEIFEPGDHCVAYRTTKGMWFGSEVVVVGRSCEVSAKLVAVDAGAQVVVSVPIKSLRSGNMLRNGSVADLLGVKLQPDLRFTSDPIDADTLRDDIVRGSLVLPGTLSLGGKPYSVEFSLEIVEHAGQRSVKGRLETTFEAFKVEVPSVMGGFIAKPHEELELIVNLDVARVDGLDAWAAAAGLD
jgi:hypothetical protein